MNCFRLPHEKHFKIETIKSCSVIYLRRLRSPIHILQQIIHRFQRKTNLQRQRANAEQPLYPNPQGNGWPLL
jgi:hypothetical protein